MPHVNLADTRILTMEDAKATLEALAHATCQIASEQARAEKRIAEVKTKCQEATAPQQAMIGIMEARITAFILANSKQFEKARTVKTDFGEFGLRAANNKLVVTDEDAAIAYAEKTGLEDLLETVTSLVKEAAKKRIKAGEQIPGCSVPTGDQAFYKISKAILESAETVSGNPIDRAA